MPRPRLEFLPAGSRPGWLLATLGSGLAWGWAAWVLPWRPEAPLALLAWVLAAFNLCAAAVLVGWPERARRALRLLALASLGAAPVFILAIAITCRQMVQMFGALGWGLAVALAAIGWLVLLGTLPAGLRLLRLTRRRAERV